MPNKMTAGGRHDCQIFHVDQSSQQGPLVTLPLGLCLGCAHTPNVLLSQGPNGPTLRNVLLSLHSGMAGLGQEERIRN